VKRKPNIHLIGIQGSGKGTQAAALVEEFGLTYIGSGNALRERAQKGDRFGRELSGVLQKGGLVESEYLLQTITDVLIDTPPTVGLVGDGIIRTVEQYTVFESVWEQFDLEDPFMVWLDISDETANKRIAMRQKEVKEGLRLDHHRVFSGRAVHRTDEHPEAIANRIALYHQFAEPLVTMLSERNQLIRIDAEPPVGDVAAAIITALRERFDDL